MNRTPTKAARTGFLRHKADRRSLLLAAGHAALVATALVLFQGGYFAELLIPALAASSFVQLIATHNAMHSPLFWNKRLNRLWQCALSLGIGYPVSVFVPVHNLSHHVNLQTPRDVLRTTEVRHRSNLLNLLHHMLMGTVHLHLLHAAYLRTMSRSHPKWFAQVRWEIASVLLLLLGVAAFSPRACLELVLLPCVLGQVLIVGFGYVQHDGCDAESDFDHSRNFLGRVFNWFIFDNGYHTIHHNRPALHWSEGRAAHRAEVVPHMHPGLDQPSLVAYMGRAFIWPGKRTRFDGTPVQLPERLQRRELWTPADAGAIGVSTGAIEA